jgi:preprotein translocase subunit YajC
MEFIEYLGLGIAMALVPIVIIGSIFYYKLYKKKQKERNQF